MFSCARALAEVNNLLSSKSYNLCLAWQILLFLLATTETGDWGTVWAGDAFNQIQVAFDFCHLLISLL